MRRKDRTIDEIHAAPTPRTKRGRDRELRELDRAHAREEKAEAAYFARPAVVAAMREHVRRAVGEAMAIGWTVDPDQHRAGVRRLGIRCDCVDCVQDLERALRPLAS